MLTETHDHDSFSHEVLFYGTRSEFVTGLVPFLREGIEAGEAILVVESAPKISVLRRELRGDADAVTFADMAAVGANPARIIPAWRDFVQRNAGSGRGLRGVGEPIWQGRTPEELIECQRHESLLNTAFAGGESWRLLCPYDTKNLPAQVIEEARRSHPFVTDGRSVAHSPDFRGVESSGGRFEAPLARPAAAVHELRFDVGSLMLVRSLVGRVAASSGLTNARASDLVQAANEVATNSIRHGGGGGVLRLWQDAKKVTCEIADAGQFDHPLIDREPPGPALAASRGLWLANQLCDLVQIRTLATGTAVRLHMNRPAASATLHAHDRAQGAPATQLN